MVYWVVSLLKAPLYKEKTRKKTERTLGTPFLKKTFSKIIFFLEKYYVYVRFLPKTPCFSMRFGIASQNRIF